MIPKQERLIRREVSGDTSSQNLSLRAPTIQHLATHFFVTLLFTSISGSAHRMQLGQTVLQSGQGWEGSMGLGLVPISDRKKTIRARIRVSVLDRRAQRLRKRDRRIQMESIDRRPAAGAFFSLQR